MIPIACPDMGPEVQAAVAEVLASGQLVQGARTAEFERQFAELCGVREAIAVSSGTAAVHLALLGHNIGPGDEVITTPFSFAGTANAIVLVGAKPVFVDIEPDTFNLDPAKVEAAITPKTRAIMPVHLYGHPAAIPEFQELVRKHNLVFIEDACQAHAAAFQGQPVGSFGTGTFSFYPTKNMTTVEGGMITTNDPEVADRVRLWRNHGQRQRYVHVAVGFNLRMTDIHAAIGLVQIKKLARWNEQRIANAATLTAQLSDVVQTPVTRPGYRHVFHQYTIRVPGDRDAFAAELQRRGIGTGIHYPKPIHKQPYYQQQGYTESFPVAETAAQQVLSLPVHPALSSADLDTIIREVRALCQ